jgi:hypothetical protein
MAVSNLYDYVSESAYDTYDRMSAFAMAIRYEAMNPVSSAIAYRLSRGPADGVAPPRWRGACGPDNSAPDAHAARRSARVLPHTPPPRHEITRERTRQCAPLSEALVPHLPN